MDINIVDVNSYGLNRGIYATATGNVLPDATCTALIAAGDAVLINYSFGLPIGNGLVTPVTASRNNDTTDMNNVLECNSASAINITVQPAATTNFPDGTILTIYQVGVGASLFVAGAGVTIQGTAPTATQYTHIAVRKRTGDTWAWV